MNLCTIRRCVVTPHRGRHILSALQAYLMTGLLASEDLYSRDLISVVCPPNPTLAQPSTWNSVL